MRPSLLALTLLAFAPGPAAEPNQSSLTATAMSPLLWTSLPDLPDREGFAGSFAGVTGGALLVAGGANFPDKRPWEGGTKVWYDDTFLLTPNAPAWRRVDRLPAASGYGVSLTVNGGVLLIGGGDAKRNFAEVWHANWDGKRLTYTAWPALPRPLAMMAGACAGRFVYVAGGVDRPDATTAQRTAYVLDLDRVIAGWRELPPFPGVERILPVAGATADAFYLFSGAHLIADQTGKTSREWLRDAYRFTPSDGWQRLADLPRVAVAAPGLAPLVNGRLLVVGGDDGAQAALAPTAHRGFPRDILAYDPATDRWAQAGEVPFSLVTTPLTIWQGRLIVPGGEARPGVRSPRVWTSTDTVR